MKYLLMTLSALAAMAAAEKPVFLNSDFNVVENKPFTLRFSGCPRSCTIDLLQGTSNDLKPVPNGSLTTQATGGSFNFLPTGYASNTYAFSIKDNDSGEINYSQQFAYQGTGVVASSAVSSQSAATTASPTSSLDSSAVIKSTVTSAPVVSTQAVTTSVVPRNTTMSTASTSARSSAFTSGISTSTTLRPTGPATQVPSSDVGRLSAPIALAVGVAAAALLG